MIEHPTHVGIPLTSEVVVDFHKGFIHDLIYKN